MKLLIITYSYAPDLTPRAFRWTALVAELARRGHEIHVLCAASAEGADPHTSGITLFRVRDWLLNASARVSVGVSALTAESRHGSVAAMRAVLRKVVRGVWRALYWPDYSCGWVIPAVFSARKLCKEHRYDWVVSVSHPFSGHVVGGLVKRYAKHSRWLVDIGDPFSLMKEPAPNNYRLYGLFNQLVERRIVRLADSISVTTASTQQMYEQYFSLPASKVRVMPPLLSIPAVPEPSSRAPEAPIKLVFVGTLYRNLRSPRYLMRYLAAMLTSAPNISVELHFYGAVNDCAEELDACPEPLKSSLFVHGLVARKDVMQAMAEADVLVNIGNDSQSQLASKVIEYMAMGKPILNIISLMRDTSLSALAEYPAVLTIERESTEPSLQALEELSAFLRQPPSVASESVEAIRKKYSLGHVADLYVSALEERR